MFLAVSFLFGVQETGTKPYTLEFKKKQGQ